MNSYALTTRARLPSGMGQAANLLPEVWKRPFKLVLPFNYKGGEPSKPRFKSQYPKTLEEMAFESLKQTAKEQGFTLTNNRIEGDPYAELKAAYRAGKTIQVDFFNGKWHDWKARHEPAWVADRRHYRIKE